MVSHGISAGFLHTALSPIAAKGLDVDAFLHEAGVLLPRPETDECRVSPATIRRLWTGLARHLDDELLGVDSRPMRGGSFSMLCETLVHCGTLDKALMHMVRFVNLILDDFRCDLQRQGDEVRLTVQLRSVRAGPRVFGHEVLLAMHHGIACWLVGRQIEVRMAEFAYPEPLHSSGCHEIFVGPVRFDAEVSAFRFCAACMEWPVIQNFDTVKRFVRRAPANLFVRYENRDGLSAKILGRLRSVERTEWPDFKTFAQVLNLTPSTLRRRLEDEGQSFRALKDQLRKDLAVDYLRDASKGIADIATDLGYSEASAFYRAFKKWTGARPTEYRQRMLGH